MPDKILFLCPHHAAKSVIAVAYFNQLAHQHGLDSIADSAGTEPDEHVSPIVVAMLKQEGMDVSTHRPRRVTSEELVESARVISMGCAPEDLDIAPERVELWPDVPMVSQNPQAARDAIRGRVETLIAQLRG